MTRASFVIGPTERVAIVGRTGSGKTTLARFLVAGDRQLVVIDPKWRVELPRAALVVGSARDFAQVYPQRTTRVVYRPDPESRDHADVDDVIRRILRYGRTRLWVDETLDFATPTRILPALRRAIVQGRELYVPVVSLAQRPTAVNNVVLSEAEHVFVFDLQVESDRDKVAGIIGDAARERPDRPFAFLYYGATTTGGRVIRCPPLLLPAAPTPPPVAAIAPDGGTSSWSARRSATSSS